MRAFRSGRLLLIILLGALLLGAGSGKRPKLVVLVAIDQFRYDYLVRFSDLFTGGFKILLSDGAVFANARYRHAMTVTCPGHAVMVTGSYGWINGITANRWWDRSQGRRVGCVRDDDYRPPRSPRNLLSGTLGDSLKLETNGRARVLALSLKDSPAIIMGGRSADGAYWYDDDSGRFTSSSYYSDRLPAWVVSFNNRKIPSRYHGNNWKRLLPESIYLERAREDAFRHEHDFNALGITFPHPMTGGRAGPGRRFYRTFLRTPFADRYLLEFARAALVSENLGKDSYTDLLALSLSSLDLIGHLFGPHSQEVMDAVLRLDKMLGEFFEFLDREVGSGSYIVALTSDHGVAPIPEYAARLKIDARRVKAKKLIGAVERALDARYGRDDWVEVLLNPYMYLNHSTIKGRRLARKEVERRAAQALMSVPGVARVYTRTQLTSGRLGPDGVSFARSFHPARSGDVAFSLKPFYILSNFDTGTTHGSPYAYDSHVPIIFYGPGINKGIYINRVGVEDIAPTLSLLLGINPPAGSEGRVLKEALSR